MEHKLEYLMYKKREQKKARMNRSEIVEDMKRNKDKPIKLDSKFYAEQNTKTDKEVEDEFNRLRAQLFRRALKGN